MRARPVDATGAVQAPPWRAAQQATPWPPGVDLTPGSGRSAGTRSLGRVVVVLCDVVGLLSLLSALVVGWLVPARDGHPIPALLDAALTAALTTSCLALGVCFLVWVARSRRYADATSAVRPRWSPTFAVAGWLVPVAGLFIGWQVLRDLWAAADPATRENPDARLPDPLPLIGWLAGLAVASVVWLAGTVVLGGAPFVDVVAAAALAASVRCLALVVRQITTWQDAHPPACG